MTASTSQTNTSNSDTMGPVLVSFESGEQPWEMAIGSMNHLHLTSSSSDSGGDDSDSQEDSLCNEAFFAGKEQATVCTVSTGAASDSSEDSLEDDSSNNEIDVDEIDAVEIDVDELIAKRSKFRSVRSSIVLLAEQVTPEPKEAAPVSSLPPIPKRIPMTIRSQTAPAAIQQRRSSIKLSSLCEPIPVKDTRSSWMNLPKPDMEKIRRAVSPEEIVRPTNKNKSRTVTFSEIHIRNYAQTIGDNPSVSYGPPIALDWNYEECQPVRVDDYEEHRGERRKLKQMGLSYYQRMSLLQHAFGHTEEDLKAAKRSANRDKFKRAVTKYFLPVSVLEDAAQSGMRKTKRYLTKRRQSTV